MRTHFILRVFALVSSLAALPALAANTALVSGVPRFTSLATDKGPTNASAVVSVTVWLKLQDSAGLEQQLAAQSDNKSSSFRQWTSGAALDAAHAPSNATVNAIKSFLSSAGLTVTGVGAHNLSVTATGSVARVQSAFQTQVHDFAYGGRTYFANISRPSVPSYLASQLGGVSITNHGPRPMVVLPVGLNGTPFSPLPLTTASPDGAFFSSQCFLGPQTQTFSASGVTATYTGNRYGQNPANGPPNLAPCGYQPSDIWSAYNLKPLYRSGLDGTGQTVAIVDAFGSTTIQQDLDTFSAIYGLPQTQITIYGTPTESNFSGTPNSGWALETTLDVEWVHAIAPGANIVLVVTTDDRDVNLFNGVAFASTLPGVVSVSNSWGSSEFNLEPSLRAYMDDILKCAGAQGVSVNFSSGDSGDAVLDEGFADVLFPASSPFATAVGGVSVALNGSHQIKFQTGWGTNLVLLAEEGGIPTDPPAPYGLIAGYGFPSSFYGGSGGGTSNFYRNPDFQRSLQSERRMVPDISWVADPYTGVEIIFTGDSAGDQFVEVIGGTSASSPMFAGLWGVASQRAGGPLGQAARLLYGLDQGAITDVVPVESPNNVSGTVEDPNGTTFYSKNGLAGPLQNSPPFTSGMWPVDTGNAWFLVTFGTDSTLGTAPGWDNVTGLGTPNGVQFVESVGRFCGR
jgi:subtilase family serine protease